MHRTVYPLISFDRKALDDFFNNPSLHDAKNAIVQIAEGGYEGMLLSTW